MPISQPELVPVEVGGTGPKPPKASKAGKGPGAGGEEPGPIKPTKPEPGGPKVEPSEPKPPVPPTEEAVKPPKPPVPPEQTPGLTPAQQAASNAAQGHPVLQCKQCANNIKAQLQGAGHHGEIIEIRGASGSDFIGSGSYNNWQTTITQTGSHVGVNVDGIVFDNIHPNGLPLTQWLQDFDAIGGIVIHSITPF